MPRCAANASKSAEHRCVYAVLRARCRFHQRGAHRENVVAGSVLRRSEIGEEKAMRARQTPRDVMDPRRRLVEFATQPECPSVRATEQAERELHPVLDAVVQKRLGIVPAQARVVARANAESELRRS